jgi:hypothetical protein
MLPATRDSRLHAWTRGLARQQAYAQKKAEKNHCTHQVTSMLPS